MLLTGHGRPILRSLFGRLRGEMAYREHSLAAALRVAGETYSADPASIIRFDAECTVARLGLLDAADRCGKCRPTRRAEPAFPTGGE